jgi:hypothetical protein
MTLEDELPRLLDELANDHAVGAPPLLPHPDIARATTHRRAPARRALLVVAVVVATTVVGLMFLTDWRNADAPSGPTPSTPTNTAPATMPLLDDPDVAVVRARAVLLAPAAGSDIELVAVDERNRYNGASGALVAPDGTVFKIVITPLVDEWLPERPEWTSIPADQRDIATIAGYEVAAVVDASSPTQIYRYVRDRCWSIEIPSAGEEMWSEDLNTLLDALTVDYDVGPVDEAAITVDVPVGWQSLGGGRMLLSWNMQLVVNVDGLPHTVQLSQVPNAAIGYVVGGESNPRPFRHGNAQWWEIDSVTTPGYTTVAGTARTTFSITSDLSADQLATIVDTLVPTPVGQLVVTPDPSATTEIALESVLPSSSLSGCGNMGMGVDLVDP